MVLIREDNPAKFFLIERVLVETILIELNLRKKFNSPKFLQLNFCKIEESLAFYLRLYFSERFTKSYFSRLYKKQGVYAIKKATDTSN